MPFPPFAIQTKHQSIQKSYEKRTIKRIRHNQRFIPSEKHHDWEHLYFPYISSVNVEFSIARHTLWGDERGGVVLPGITSRYWSEEIVKEYLFDPIIINPSNYEHIVQLWKATLLYFFNQPSSEQNLPAGIRAINQINILEARRRAREVKFDRGQIRDAADSEASLMADTRKRIESYARSTQVRLNI